MATDDAPEALRETSRAMAEALVDGLVGYANALHWLQFYISSGGAEEAALELDRYARNVGLEIIAMVRIAEALRPAFRDAPASLDLRSALPLAHALGESYALLLAAQTVEIAERLPVAQVDRIRELFTPSVRAWMAH